jgi:DNA-binding helix-hairpin-helix protein with protein kinase domain
MALTSVPFEPGHRVQLIASGYDATIKSTFGAGGQGIVYCVDVAGSLYALKWYHPFYLPHDPRLRSRLAEAIERKSPDHRFLWPIELVESKGQPSFGYLMLVRPQKYKPSSALLGVAGKRLDPSLAVRTMACLNVAESFHQLHAKGFCYQDINLNNLFLDPTTGAVCICDNDNVDVNGMPGAIYGTKKFMAPEVVRHEILPNTATDLFSMAVLFFYLLHSWHPLDGRREFETDMLGPDDELRLYGSQPVFIFDPQDDSNGPVPGVHDSVVRRWKSLTESVRKLFVQSFTTGLAPAGRAMQTAWLPALSRMNDLLLSCPQCGYEQALANTSDPVNAGSSFACVACNAAIPSPLRLVIGRESILLSPSRALYPHHLSSGDGYRFDTAAALVQPHPTNANILGLRNLTKSSWSAGLPDGRKITVEPERSVGLVSGLAIDFGSRRGLVR